jgi:aflatoxin B1 aldehyde reductase
VELVEASSKHIKTTLNSTLKPPYIFPKAHNTPPKMTHPQLLFGGLNIASGVFNTEQDVSRLLEVLQSLGLNRIDTAAVYPNTCPGRSEQLLGESGAGEKSFIIDTKIMVSHPLGKGTLRAGEISASISDSLQRLKSEVRILAKPLAVFFSSIQMLITRVQINILYCHMPDPDTPVKETATALDFHYKLKHFKKVSK